MSHPAPHKSNRIQRRNARQFGHCALRECVLSALLYGLVYQYRSAALRQNHHGSAYASGGGAIKYRLLCLSFLLDEPSRGRLCGQSHSLSPFPVFLARHSIDGA
ncbi:Uncharacterised protein [Vibrio cholerae]|nr:Uncharacterised protein [Vibrio cholerae]CSC16634.1 Uncharacterised protein [Vibrio cholerae]